jgi:hypothetical protein
VLSLIACSEPEPAAQMQEPTTLPVIEVPALTIRSPRRGAFVGDDEQLAIEGSVKRGSARIQSLVVNGQTVSIASEGGEFSGSIPLSPGVNVIGARVEATDGGRAVDGRAVMAGDTWDVHASLSKTMKIQLGPELLDDDKRDHDDMAALAEAIMADPSMAEAFVGTELPTDYYTITVTGASFGDSSVDVTPGSGALTVAVSIENVQTDFDIAGAGAFSWLSTTGSGGADVAELTMELELSADDGVVTATPTSTEVSLDGFWVTVDWFPDSLEDDLAGWIQSTVEEQVASTVQEQVAELIGEYLSAFETEVEFSGLQLHVALASLRVAEAGVYLTMDAWTRGEIAISLPADAGSLRTDDDGPAFPLTEDQPFAVAADDDFLNQLLFNMWASGATTGITFGGLELTALAGEIPAPIGPVSETVIDLGLPTTLGEPTWEGMDFDLSIGEMGMTITREDGEVIQASINLRTGANLEMAGDEAGFSLDDRPAYMTIEVGMEQSPGGLDPGDVAALFRLTMPTMLGTV